MIFKILATEKQEMVIDTHNTVRNWPEKYIQDRDAFWEKTVLEGKAKGKTFWNGLLYTIEHATQYDTNKIKLTLGICEYKDFLFLRKKGPEHIEHNYGKECLIVTCGVSCLPITSDGKIIIGKKRSSIYLTESYEYIAGMLNTNELKIRSFSDIEKFAYNELLEESRINSYQIEDIEFYQVNYYLNYAEFQHLVYLKLHSSDLHKIEKPNAEFSSFVALTPDEIKAFDGPMLPGLLFLRNYVDKVHLVPAKINSLQIDII